MNYFFFSERGIFKNLSKKWLQPQGQLCLLRNNFLILSGTGKKVISNQGKGLKTANSENYKGQLISKCLFGVFNFFQKTERNQVNLSYHSSKVEFAGSFFGRNAGLKKSFRLCLTFSNRALFCGQVKK